MGGAERTCALLRTHVRMAVDASSYLADTRRSCSLQSALPDVVLKEECCMGIDEAGRGPVLGKQYAILTDQWDINDVTLLAVRTNGVWRLLLSTHKERSCEEARSCGLVFFWCTPAAP